MSVAAMPLTGKSMTLAAYRARTSFVSLLQTRMAEAFRAHLRRAASPPHGLEEGPRSLPTPFAAGQSSHEVFRHLLPSATGPQTKGTGRAGAMKLGIHSLENVI